MILISNKISFENPDNENINGILYEKLKLGFPERGLNTFQCLKIQLLVFLAFILQDYPHMQVMSFIIVYLGSFSFQVKMKAYIEIIDFIHLLFSEFLFLILSCLFLVYNLFHNLNTVIHSWIKNTLLIIMILIMSNEVLFSIIDIIVFIINLCCETSISSFIKKRSKILHLRIEILKQRSKYSSNRFTKTISERRIRQSKIIGSKMKSNFNSMDNLLNSNLNRKILPMVFNSKIHKIS